MIGEKSGLNLYGGPWKAGQVPEKFRGENNETRRVFGLWEIRRSAKRLGFLVQPHWLCGRLRYSCDVHRGEVNMNASFKIRAESADEILRDESVPIHLKAEMIRDIFDLGGGENAR
uniref:Uncharacterized protein n=1 Tax=uncultured marine bacterium HF4000_APKG2098 TaxID=455614 RepID=B3TCP0_9BACT|nr:hypothetical protein ALOHA_HF4000APKG2098ctg7 [uncultured marine bacterium HF4000_APKG2098]